MDPATQPAAAQAFIDLVRRVQCEFLEMPGLRLTEPQLQRLSGLDRPYCASVLRVLVDAEFLVRTKDGCFMRLDRAQPVKVELSQDPLRSPKIPAA